MVNWRGLGTYTTTRVAYSRFAIVGIHAIWYILHLFIALASNSLRKEQKDMLTSEK